MSSIISTLTLLDEDVWKHIVCWDSKLAKKIENEGKKHIVCKQIGKIKTIIDCMMTYKNMSNLSDIFNVNDMLKKYESIIHMLLCHVIYHIPYPENNFKDENWKAHNFHVIKQNYDEIRKNIMNKPFEPKNIELTIITYTYISDKISDGFEWTY